MTCELLLLLILATADSSDGAVVLPTRFETDRVYVVPQTTDGSTLLLYTDSGGGIFLNDTAVKRLKLQTVPVTDLDDLRELGKDAKLTKLPEFRAERSIPPPADGRQFVVLPKHPMFPGWPFDEDGMLGEPWFGGHIWTWDYPSRQLILQGSRWRPDEKAMRIALGFKSRDDGKRDNNFPRITIRVDGKPIDVLLDTGATTLLTPSAMDAVHDGLPAARATSMIVESLLQSWHVSHPDWRVIDDAQAGTHSAMIEVPEVEIAGSKVGPVWFTSRPDGNFHGYMSSMMDRQVEGAIGGNALGHFVMTIDYPNAVAYFRCTKKCITPPPAP